MFGKIQLKNFEACKLPQKAASAFSILEGLDGASYKPLIYGAEQEVKGVNHWFIAEMTLNFANNERHIVLLAINEFEGNFELVKKSIEVIL